MTVGTDSIQNFNIKNLDGDWKLATVYMAYLTPRTPQEALRLIYRGASTGVSENWVINTRKKLCEMGYIAKIDEGKRNSRYISDITPISNLVLSYQKSAFFKHKNAGQVIQSLHIFLNSQWFREFFSDTFILSPIMNSDMTIYSSYADMFITTPSGLNQKMEISNLAPRLTHLLHDIGYYSHNIRWEMFSLMDVLRVIDESDEILLSEIISIHDFDILLQQKKGLIPGNLLNLLCMGIKIITKDRYYGRAPLRLFQKLLRSGAGFFIPNDFALMFRLLPRFPYAPEPLDFGVIRKKLYSLQFGPGHHEYDPHCVDHYLAGVTLGKEHL